MRTFVLILAVAAGLFACAETETVKFANAECPMMGGDVDPEGEVVVWEGQNIGFCCDGCGDKFKALSEEEKVAHLIDNGGMDLPRK